MKLSSQSVWIIPQLNIVCVSCVDCQLLSSSVCASSPASLPTQFLPMTSWFVGSIYLAIRKTPSPSEGCCLCLCRQFFLFLWRQFMPQKPQPSCLPTSRSWRLQSVYASLVQLHLHLRSFHHQVSGLHWWLLERSHTSVATYNSGPFSFDQADSIRLAVLAAAPATVATAATRFITFILKANWNWLAATQSLRFQVGLKGENLRFCSHGLWGKKSHTSMWCCLMHSLLGITFTLLTALFKSLW